MHGVIALWSAPRSRSTAFLRMMMGRGDVVSLHEPFSRLADFGDAEIGDTVVHSESELIAEIRRLGESATVFFKDTTDFRYPGVLADTDFLRDVRHTFIIRNPADVIASHFALNPELSAEDVGFSRLHELYEAVERAQGGVPPVVVDSDALLERPEDTVRAYCARTGLPYAAGSLTWSPGMPEDFKLTERWHVDAGESSGFERRERTYADTVDNNDLLRGFYEDQLPFYTRLYERRLVLG
ncbi:sulfotransferase family protein [Streptomyces sp. NPDC090022]|uniref:sulfotransferase-like domain-containing protein n=1 Tax=Streptomyces sp. NPDC090022 TaxID=3365920 RepID=UPI0037F1F3E0